VPGGIVPRRQRHNKLTVAGKEKSHSTPVRVRPSQKELPLAPCVGAQDASTLKESQMTIKSMNDLFLHTLKDIYYAEKQIYKNLPKMAKSAKSPDLKRAFEKHREETDGHIERLEIIFDQCDVAARAIRCDAMDGILAEAKDVMSEIEDGKVHDAGILAAAQTVEHYEIARYGTLIAWADQLGMKDASKLLGETLDEEKKTDQLLTRLAEANINQKAA
jgi:ferritin-like metal-binding protein YciE